MLSDSDTRLIALCLASSARKLLLEAFEALSGICPAETNRCLQTAIEAAMQAEEELLRWKA